jgi:peptidoglycan/xylan/chitin deacetylase (PgdA/CDA1 family)
MSSKKPKSKYVKRILSVIAIALCLLVIIPCKTTPYEKSYNVSVQSSSKMIALTFDDGPSQYTPQLLDALENYNAKASFFLLGKKVDGNEDTIKRMQNDGYLICNHTYTHCTLFNTAISNYIEEINDTDDKIFEITGEKTEFFRPPHGYYLGLQLNKIDKIAVLWSNDPADWKHLDADYVYNYLIENADDGKIFLLHDTKQTTVEGVIRAIKDLQEEGYEFVRVDELLCRNGDSLSAGLAYRGCKDKKSPTYF